MDILLYGILFTALLSLLLNIFLKNFDLPVIIGYIVAGAIITHLFALHETHRQHLFEIAEFGIVFLMFTIGLELPLNQLKALKREVFVFGFLQVLVSIALFFAIGLLLFGLESKTALIVASALALSSTAIVLKMLKESGDIGKVYGRQVLGILLYQDLAVIPLLLMVSLFSQSGQNVWTLIAETIASGFLALLILYIFGKYALEFYFKLVSRTKSQEIFIESILVIVLASAALSHFFGFSYSLGAFFAGMMIAETRYRIQVEANLVPFRDLLLGIFFITVGLQINFDFLLENILSIILIVVAIMAAKAGIIFSIVRLFSISHISMKTALTLSQVGEFSFAILELSRISGLIEAELNQTLIIAVVFSMILTPFMLKRINVITKWLEPDREMKSDIEHIESMKNHVVVVGYGRLGQHMVKHLRERKIDYIVIEFHSNLLDIAKERGDNVIFGDATDKSVLEHLCIKEAAVVVIAIYDESRIAHLIGVLEEYHEQIHIVARISDFSQAELLEHLNSHSSVNENDVVSKAMVNEALSCRTEQLAPNSLNLP